MAKLYVVGIGPGNEKHMTAAARAAIEGSDVICGYELYLELIKDMTAGREIYASPMTKEMDRCRYAVKRVKEGKTVALVCSGDPGVYGMAGPLLSVAEDIDAEVVPGVSAAESGAAVLGAPLTDDHCCISLSDINTPRELIEKRLLYASEADLVIVIYNPMSKHRPDNLKKACEVMLGVKGGDTVCGYVRNIAREGEEKRILTLAELKDEKLDMFTTVFIGNSKTREIRGRMVTPRGYER
ncbi:MAG: precorrin-3B C(17)-methyltransferase [Lachnospiraceae bacterium]|nr:precorrin-3B C(17)-methyltransferase [Lachnospiraceae bacterium]